MTSIITSSYFESSSGDELLQSVVDEVCRRCSESEDDCFPSVISECQPHLLGDDNTKRGRAVEFLNALLAVVSENVVQEETMELLAEYFISRFRDDATRRSSLESLLKILTRFPQKLKCSTVSQLIVSLFADVRIRIQPVALRIIILDVLKSAVEFEEGSAASPDDFLGMYLHFVDGERDPRCLLRIFRVTSVAASCFSNKGVSEELMEELFDSVSCYWPVAFRNSQGGDKGVTREDIVESLEKAMIDSGRWMRKLSFVFLVGKLSDESLSDSELQETYEIVGKCIRLMGGNSTLYELPDLLAFLRGLQWEKCKKSFLGLIRSIAETLCSECNESVCVHLMEHIGKPLSDEMSLAMVTTILDVCTEIRRIAVDWFVSPLLMEAMTLVVNEEEMNLDMKMKYLVRMIDRILRLDDGMLLLKEEAEKISKVFGVLSKELELFGEISERKCAVRAAGNMCRLDIISESDKLIQVDVLVTTSLNDTSDSVRHVACKQLSRISEKQPNLILSGAISKLISAIVQGSKSSWNALHCVAASHKLVFENALEWIITQTEQELSNSSNENSNISERFDFLISIFMSIRARLVDFYENDYSIVVCFMAAVVRILAKLDKNDVGSVMKICSTLSACIFPLPFQVQEELAKLAIELWCDGGREHDTSFEKLFFSHINSVSKSLVLPFVVTVISSLRRETTLPDLSHLIEELCNDNCYKKDLFTGLLLGSMANKSYSDDISSAMSMLEGEALVWSVKGLLLKWHDLTEQYLHRLTQQEMNDPNFRLDVFGILLDTEMFLLNNQTHVLVDEKYPSKLFDTLIDEVMERIKKGDNWQFVSAFVRMCSRVPRSTLKKRIGDIIPALFASLESKDLLELTDIKSKLLDTCLLVVHNSERGSLGDKLEVFVRKVLFFVGDSRMSVRIKALQVIHSLPAHEEHEDLIHMRRDVCWKISSALDDTKRLVRQEAVKANNVWLMIVDA